MKTIFITGASSGLGKASAQLFAARGWNVIATMRSPEQQNGLEQIPNIRSMALDVTDSEQVSQVVQEVTSQYQIDVVFNNAGYGLIGPLETVTDEQLTRQFETNVLGVIRIARAFIPHFRKRRGGLFITTTSIAGLIGLPLTSVYCATKWALEGWTEGLAFELNELGIGIKTVAPGGIKTDFTGRSLDTTAHEAYRDMSEKLYNGFDPEHFTPVQEIAEVVYEAATDGKDQLRYVAGSDARSIEATLGEVGREAFRKQTHQLYFG